MHSSLPRPLLVAALLLAIGALVGCQGAAPVAQPAAPAPVSTTAAAPAAINTPASAAGSATTPLATTAAGAATTPMATSAAGAATTPLTTSAAMTPLATSAALETTPLATSALTSPLGTPAATAPAATSQASVQGTPSTLPVLGAGINAVTYSATDSRYTGPATFPSGWTQLTLTNQGHKSHDLQLVGIAAGKTITDVIKALQAQGPPDWATLYGGITAEPGQSASWVVNPPPGNYVIFSFGQAGPSQPPDALQGLINAITVTAPQAGATQPVLPTTSAMISMVDYNFVVTGTLKAGAQMVGLSNNGKELHEADFLPLKPGKTLADFNKVVGSEMSGTPVAPADVPFDMGPSLTLSPGVTVYYPLTLRSADYVLACFVPSPTHNGEPHAALGMVKQVPVR